MSFRCSRSLQLFVLLALSILQFAPSARAQIATGSLRGQVTDPSGSAVTTAKVTVTWPTGKVTTADTVHDGRFEVKDLPAGKYGVAVTAKGFAPFEVLDYEIAAGQVQKLDVTLSLEVKKEKVIVESTTPTVEVSPEANVGAIVMTQNDLDALSDDPDELENDLEALAGPSAGPSGGQIYIDGFTAGQLPPKSAIREIRINQNPFSSEYDKLGYGRIEIFTKPGMDQLHGNFEFTGNDSAFNSKNPFAISEPGYESTLFSGNIGGPISKKASVYFTSQYRDINDVSVVDAPSAPAGVLPNQSIPTPRTRVNLGPRIDYQLTPTNTLTVRYQYYRDDLSNQGVGGFSLETQAYHSLTTEHTLQIGDTQVFGTKIVNETRFQLLHSPFEETPEQTTPAVVVPGAFTGGGNVSGTINQDINHYEFQNYTQIALKKHTIKFGARLREVTDNDYATSGFNGTFYFSSIAAYEAVQAQLQLAPTIPITGPVQYVANTGQPRVIDSLFDGGFYVGDDWKARPNLTVSGGLRLETQTSIHDHLDWAPRLALAWGIGHGKAAPKTVLRAGSGIFYDRFTEGLLQQVRRLNGITQLATVVTSPCFSNMALTLAMIECAGSQALSTTYRIAPNLHAPGVLQNAVVLERQLTKVASLSLTYLNSRGFDQLYTNNINTPELGTYNPAIPSSGIRPYGFSNIYEYQSEGVFRQNQFFAQFTVRAGAKVTLFSNYVLNYAKSDTSGPNSFPSNPFNLQQDYGRASFDYRNRFFMGGSFGLPHGFRLSPFVVASSGQPYSITLSQDLIGSSQFNQRPAFASPASLPQNVVVTPYGSFDTVPGADEARIPVNSLDGPARFTMNLRVSKTWGFGALPESAASSIPGGGGGGGPRGPGGGRGGPGGGGFGGFGGGAPTNKRYNLTLSVNARNIFNYTNEVTPSAVLNPPIPACQVPSPPPGCASATPSGFFARPNQLAQGPFSSQGASRIVYLQMSFSF